MAFVNNKMPIVSHKIGYFAFSHQALDNGLHRLHLSAVFFSATDDPDTVSIDIEECAQTSPTPLIQQICLPMY